MKRTLIVVDMQNDFIDMTLGTKEAVAIVPKVKAKIQKYVQNGAKTNGGVDAKRGLSDRTPLG